MTRYDDLGVRPVINAAAAQTLLGGSLMPQPVLDAIAAAAGAFVHVPELHDRVGERLADITGNESACVSCGAAAGILMAVAACMTGEDPARVTALPDTTGFERTEVISFLGHTCGFLSAVRETGARLIEVHGDRAAFEAAFSPLTAAVLWFAGDFWAEDSLPLDETLEIAHRHGVPVIVDAADQIPPVSRLWEYTRERGADLAIFSGGKGLRGPQSSGLIVGRADLIRACRANTGPLHSIARPAKVGKEEMLGLLAAVEWSLSLDADATARGWDATVALWIEGLAQLPDVRVWRSPHSHSSQPIPRAILELGSTADRDALIAGLWDQSPRIAVLPEGERAIGLNPQAITADEAPIVLAAIEHALAGV